MSSNNGKAPTHLNDITVQAIDKIGSHAADQIEAAAGEIRNEADVVARGLEDLAHAIREHTIKASEQVSSFVQKTTHTLGVVRELQERMKDVGDGGELRSGGSDSKDSDRTHRQTEVASSGSRLVSQREGQPKPDANSDAGGRAPRAH